MEKIIRLLHEGSYSCVIENHNEIRTFSRRGVDDLYDLVCNDASFLKGASMADKVVGKGAAALMALGGIGSLYTDVISTPALELLRNTGIEVTFGKEVPYIINREKNGQCPLEKRCGNETDICKLFPIITDFIESINANQKSNTIQK